MPASQQRLRLRLLKTEPGRKGSEKEPRKWAMAQTSKTLSRCPRVIIDSPLRLQLAAARPKQLVVIYALTPSCQARTDKVLFRGRLTCCLVSFKVSSTLLPGLFQLWTTQFAVKQNSVGWEPQSLPDECMHAFSQLPICSASAKPPPSSPLSPLVLVHACLWLVFPCPCSARCWETGPRSPAANRRDPSAPS